MLHTQCVSKELLELLTQLSVIEVFQNLYLVGGTALALQVGHRNSIDIDLFGEHQLDNEVILSNFQKLGKVEIIGSSKSILAAFVNEIKVDVVKYPYQWLKEPVVVNELKMASLEDIAAMKIAAITQRGSKKDFIDLYYLLKQFTLKEILQFYSDKITDGNLWLAIRSLTFFNDADIQPSPKLFSNTSWEHMKSIILKEVQLHLKNN